MCRFFDNHATLKRANIAELGVSLMCPNTDYLVRKLALLKSIGISTTHKKTLLVLDEI